MALPHARYRGDHTSGQFWQPTQGSAARGTEAAHPTGPEAALKHTGLYIHLERQHHLPASRLDGCSIPELARIHHELETR